MKNEVELLKQMVSIPSVSRDEAQLSAFLVEAMNALGLKASQDEAGNAIGIKQNGSDAEIEHEVVLLGHMDTVPGTIPVRIDQQQLYGRGSVDAKGPLATFIMAASQATPPPRTRFVVAAAVEEEVSSSKGAREIARCYRPSVCIIGEPSGWNALTLGYKGCLQLEYKRRQPCGHSAGPQGSAAEAACDWWTLLRDHAVQVNADQPRLFDQLMPTLRSLMTSSDGLHDTVVAHVGVRLPPDFDTEGYLASVQAWAGEAQLRSFGHEPAHITKRSAKIVGKFSRALAQRDQRMVTKLKTGTSDMNVVARHWSCPIVAYGPGDSTLDHTPDEHLDLDEYQRAIEVLADVLTQCRPGSG